MTKIETLVNQALDAVELARSKLSTAVDTIADYDFGDSGDSFITNAEESGKKLLAAFQSLEDLYGSAEDLGEAP